MKRKITLALLCLISSMFLCSCGVDMALVKSCSNVAAEQRGWVGDESYVPDDGAWLSDQILIEAASKAVITTSSRGDLRLNEFVTRAEIINMFNNGLGLTESGKNRFSDVKRSDWYYEDYCKAWYITGFSDGTARPNDTISRGEVAVIVARLLDLQPDLSPIYQFADESKIPTWACYGVGSSVKAGLFTGYPDGTFKPSKKLSRAEAILLAYNVVNRHQAPQ